MPGPRRPPARPASAAGHRPATTAGRACPATGSRVGITGESGDQLLGRLVEVVGDEHPTAPRTRGPRLRAHTGRDEPGDRLAGPGDDDVLPRLDGLEQPREVGLRLVDVDGDRKSTRLNSSHANI